MPDEPYSAPATISIPDACKRLGLSRSTLYKLKDRGSLRFIKILGKTCITRVELERFVASLEPEIS